MNGYYINLNHRVDRKNHMEKLIKNFEFFKNIERFEAIQNDNGALGCISSHYNILTKMENTDKNYFIILEDDFFIFNGNHFNNFVKEFEKIKDNEEWDIVTLTPRGETINTLDIFKNNNFLRIKNNQTTGGYIIKKKFIPILKNLLHIGIQKMINGDSSTIYAIDQIWKLLQNDNTFLYYKHIFAGQLPGYSDIEKRNTNYNIRYLEQNKY